MKNLRKAIFTFADFSGNTGICVHWLPTMNKRYRMQISNLLKAAKKTEDNYFRFPYHSDIIFFYSPWSPSDIQGLFYSPPLRTAIISSMGRSRLFSGTSQFKLWWFSCLSLHFAVLQPISCKAILWRRGNHKVWMDIENDFSCSKEFTSRYKW